MRIPAAPAGWAALAAARALDVTWRWRRRDPGDGKWAPARPPLPLEPAIYALWHEHLLPLVLMHRGQGAMALVSRHRDGEILARVLGGLGYRTARGSSTRGGKEGLRRMIRAGREGTPLAWTPDGPRGPARRCKGGIVAAARATGLPVIPVAAAAAPARRLPSWDRFLVPAPGARVFVSRGPPLRVEPASPGPGSTSPGSEVVAERQGTAGPARAGTDGGGRDGPEERIAAALEAERRRCEAAAGSAP